MYSARQHFVAFYAYKAKSNNCANALQDRKGSFCGLRHRRSKQLLTLQGKKGDCRYRAPAPHKSIIRERACKPRCGFHPNNGN